MKKWERRDQRKDRAVEKKRRANNFKSLFQIAQFILGNKEHKKKKK